MARSLDGRGASASSRLGFLRLLAALALAALAAEALIEVAEIEVGGHGGIDGALEAADLREREDEGWGA
nr:unnamed protein product [Digitaria exilis]